jgi:hypothetical protein
MKTTEQDMADVLQHAATAEIQDTINMSAQRSLKIGSSSKIIEYLQIKAASFHALDGMAHTPIHGASGMNIVKKPTLFNKSAKRRRVLPPPVSPPLVSVASAEVVSILVGTARLWTPSLRIAMRPTPSGEQPHIRSWYRITVYP